LAVELAFKKKNLTACGVNGLCWQITLMYFLMFLGCVLIVLLLRMPSNMDLESIVCLVSCIYTGNCESVLENYGDVFSRSRRIEMTSLPQLGLI